MELARAKDTKERMDGVERLHELLESSKWGLTAAETTALVECCLVLFEDNNFRVSQGGLQGLASAAVLSGEHLKLHLKTVVPAVVERLGDGKQPVRDAARRLLLTLMEVSSPTITVERAGMLGCTKAGGCVKSLLEQLPRPSVFSHLRSYHFKGQFFHPQAGLQFCEELHRHSFPSSMVKDINARLEKIVPRSLSSDGLANNFSLGEMKPMTVNPKRSSPRAKSASREMSLFEAGGDITEKPSEPIKVYSEKELIREFEKIALTLAHTHSCHAKSRRPGFWSEFRARQTRQAVASRQPAKQEEPLGKGHQIDCSFDPPKQAAPEIQVL